MELKYLRRAMAETINLLSAAQVEAEMTQGEEQKKAIEEAEQYQREIEELKQLIERQEA